MTSPYLVIRLVCRDTRGVSSTRGISSGSQTLVQGIAVGVQGGRERQEMGNGFKKGNTQEKRKKEEIAAKRDIAAEMRYGTLMGSLTAEV